ncbi:MAG: primosomal protein N' [Epsilonproteobacteria bacterium]|nr:MAG: primosomal protein N' [Campylobacterota bacterium]RLA67566.1 MAG: primosomal protein N' [Campylobacterota bacterium]
MTDTENTYCQVAVNNSFNNSILTYAQGDQELKPGQLVEVPLGKRLIKGMVLRNNLKKEETLKGVNLKVVKGILSEEIQIDGEELTLFEWMSDYYHYALGPLIFDCLPGFLKRPRELKYLIGKNEEFPFEPTEDQQKVIDTIGEKLFSGFSKWLIHGVTGSGKTLIYLLMAQKVLKKDKTVLFILPEINLTPQFLKTFETYLGVPIYSYNSSVSKSDKFGLWKLLQNDKSPKVILGVRSSIFLPIKNLGLIVVDEEHDPSFKQEDRCPYNARDVATKRAHILKIPIILGSATPSLETFFSFCQDKMRSNYFRLSKRIGDSTLPKIEYVDMKGEYDADLWPFKTTTLEKIEQALDKGEQILVYVNRLGFARYLQCRSCGHKFSCPNCSLNLRYFKARNELDCPFCEYKDKAPEICPECSNLKIFQKGFGTEKLSSILNKRFPEIKIERFDRDELKTIKNINACLERYNKGEIDILVGTQMLSKGHNFKNTNLVIVLGTDNQLNFPDFRSNERVFQQLVQVSGRSGRFAKKSEVLVHTLNKDNKVYSHVEKSGEDSFYDEEIFTREMLDLPPFSRVVMLYFTSKFQTQAMEGANLAKAILKRLTQEHFDKVNIQGPRASLVERRANKFTWAILLKSSDINHLHNLISTFKNHFKPHYSVSLKIDVDPYQIQ